MNLNSIYVCMHCVINKVEPVVYEHCLCLHSAVIWSMHAFLNNYETRVSIMVNWEGLLQKYDWTHAPKYSLGARMVRWRITNKQTN